MSRAINLRWRLSYDGESDYEGTVDGKPIRLCVRYDLSYRPERNRRDVNAPGTVYWYCHSEQFPPDDVMQELSRVRLSGDPVHNKYCHPVCCSHTALRPVRYDSALGMFVDASGNPAHCAM